MIKKKYFFTTNNTNFSIMHCWLANARIDEILKMYK